MAAYRGVRAADGLHMSVDGRASAFAGPFLSSFYRQAF